MTHDPTSGRSVAVACLTMLYFLFSWTFPTEAQRLPRDIFGSDAVAKQLSHPLTAPRLTSVQFKPNPALYQPQLQLFVKSYPFPPEHACLIAINGLEPDEYVSTTEGVGRTCYWLAPVPDTNGARCAAAAEAARLEPDCPALPIASTSSLFFIARGDAAVTRTLRIKLNSRADTLRADLPFLLDVLENIYQERSWTVPNELANAVAQGEDVTLEDAGIRYQFSREFGEVPRYNLSLTFPVWQATSFD